MTTTKTLTLIGGLAASLFGLAPAAASPGPIITVSGDLPPLHTEFETWDVCQAVDDLIENLGFVSEYMPRLCDYTMTQSFAVGVASVSIAGTLDSLVVHDGMVALDGSIAGTIELSPLTIEGGRAPVFAPCDRGAFPGCIQPDAEMLAGLLAAVDRTPAIDVELPAPNRMCVPGLPIVVKPGRWIPATLVPGRWVGWTWHPPSWKPGRLVLPELELCRITDWGEFPTVTLPQVQRATLDAYPHVTADMGVSIAGDGVIEVEVPIPYTGVSAGYGNEWVDLHVGAGMFLIVTLQVENAGADAHLVFDQDLHVRLTYERGVGWSQHVTVLRDESSPSIVPHDASVTLRAALKLGLEAAAKAGIPDGDAADAGDAADSDDASLPPLPVSDEVQCAADWAFGGATLEIGVEASAALELFVEGTYPLFSDDADPTFEVDAGLEFSHAEALSIPGMCEIGCETVAGEDNPACAPVEVFRVPVASL